MYGATVTHSTLLRKLVVQASHSANFFHYLKFNIYIHGATKYVSVAKNKPQYTWTSNGACTLT